MSHIVEDSVNPTLTSILGTFDLSVGLLHEPEIKVVILKSRTKNERSKIGCNIPLDSHSRII